MHVSLLKFWESDNANMPLPTERQSKKSLPAIAAYFWMWGGTHRRWILPTILQVFHSCFDQEALSCLK